MMGAPYQYSGSCKLGAISIEIPITRLGTFNMMNVWLRAQYSMPVSIEFQYSIPCGCNSIFYESGPDRFCFLSKVKNRLEISKRMSVVQSPKWTTKRAVISTVPIWGGT